MEYHIRHSAHSNCYPDCYRHSHTFQHPIAILFALNRGFAQVAHFPHPIMNRCVCEALAFASVFLSCVGDRSSPVRKKGKSDLFKALYSQRKKMLTKSQTTGMLVTTKRDKSKERDKYLLLVYRELRVSATQ